MWWVEEGLGVGRVFVRGLAERFWGVGAIDGAVFVGRPGYSENMASAVAVGRGSRGERDSWGGCERGDLRNGVWVWDQAGNGGWYFRHVCCCWPAEGCEHNDTACKRISERW